MNIVLIGYMASGKSKIGKELAKILSYNFIDLDNVIENKERKSINAIFNRYGELYFRKIEKKYLEELLTETENSIISLGGGTPCYFNTMDTLIANKDLKTIFLRVSIPVLISRLNKEKSKRPMIAHLKTDDLLAEFIGKHLFERVTFYNKAEFKIDGNRSVDEIVEDIVAKLF